ncbi:MAG: hypothetical protein ACOCV4_07640 [Myxococcota bacterium]
MTEPTDERSWVCVLDVEGARKPGVAARIAHVFGDRGINLDDLLAVTHQGRPLVLLRFRASVRLRDYMVRRLGRIQDVHDVRTLPSDHRPLWKFVDPSA